MKDDEMMMMEEGVSVAESALLPAVADSATAALSAAQEQEPEPPEDEVQEDPYAGRRLPGETPQPEVAPLLAEDDVWGEEEEAEEESAPPAPPPVPPHGTEGAGSARAPLPAAEAAPSATSAEQQRYWRELLTGSLDTVPAAVRERAGVEDPALTDAQRDYRLSSAINRSWAVDHMGLSREEVRARWAQLRAELARRFRVADDEQELFTALSVEAQDAPRRERVRELYEAHCGAALLGEPSPPLPDGDEEMPYAAELAEEAQRKGLALRERYLPLARELAVGLDVFAGLEDEAIAAPRVFSAVPEFARAVEALADMDEGSRRLVYAMAQAEFRQQHPQQGESLYRTMLRATRRSATGLGVDVGQALTHASVATLNSLGRTLGGSAGETLHAGAEGLDLRARIVEETRRLLHDEIKPLRVSEEAGLVSQLMVDAAGGTPAALVACSGGAGFAALSLSGVGASVSAARQRAPEGSQWLQYLAGVVAGSIQAGIYSGMGRVGGKMLANSISQFARSSGRGGGYSLAALGALGAFGAEEAKLLFASKAAEAVDLGAQELAARLEKTASNIDWKAYGDNAQDVELNLREAAMNLPFILIGSGRVALRHFRSRHAVLGDGHALQQWGIDEVAQEAIMKERDIDRQGDMLGEALRSSRRWSAPGFIVEALRSMRLLNTDYYQGFKNPQEVVDFLRLPSQGGLLRPPVESYSADNPEHVRLLEARHGSGEKVNRSRFAMALQLWDEWSQKAHRIPAPTAGESGEGELLPLPTAERRRYFGLELLREHIVPRRMRLGGFYAPQAEAERMAFLRDRVAEIHSLSYQMLMSSFTLDSLSHNTRGLDHMRQACESARQSMLEAVGRCVLRRATGVPEHEAQAELGAAIGNNIMRRRYSNYPPAWLGQVPTIYTRRLNEYASDTFAQDLTGAPPEFQDVCRVVLGLRACASALYELLPTTPDFQTALARGLSPADAYVHLLSRELGVDMSKASGVEEMMAPFSPRATDMRSWRLRNEEAFAHYSTLTGFELERARGGENGSFHWRLRRPNGSYTHWHRRRSDAINEMMAHCALTFMPFSYERTEPLHTLRPEKGYDLNTAGQAGAGQYTGFEQLCRIALRDTARSWVESAPYALPGFELSDLRRYIYLGGGSIPLDFTMMRESAHGGPYTMQVDSKTLSSPLRLAQARFHTYWWRQLNSGLLSPEQAGEELVRLRVLSPGEWQRVSDIAKPRLKPSNPNTPLRLTPPPDVAGMNRALASHLTSFSMRYFLSHLDDMPLPPSAREWFRLAPLCSLEVGELPEQARRLSLRYDAELLTCLQNRIDARQLRELAPGVAELRRVEREGLLRGSPLLTGFRSAVGLNRTRNMEQAWCANESGGAAMMAVSQPFWQLMERPREGWEALDEVAQESLRSHVGLTCHREPSLIAVEAEARGESPDFLLCGLSELQEVLSDYPVLHQYGLMPEDNLGQVRQLALEEAGQGLAPFAEPEYDITPVYSGGSLQAGFRLGAPTELPEDLRSDTRVLPALHLLGTLRSYPASRPFARHGGIEWRGELYGGTWGRRPTGLDENWMPETPLRDLLILLRRVDELKTSLPEGEELSVLGMELPGLGGELDLSPLSNITLYRHLESPSRLCRLMPGEPDAATPTARSPYVVQSVGGMSMGRQFALHEPENMYRAFTPLEKFHPVQVNIRRESSREEFCRRAQEYTLSGALSSTMRMASQSNPQGGLPSLRELLLRFAEDSGFSLSLRNADPRTLSAGEIHTLRLAREMLLCLCGPEPDAAYRRLVRLGHRIRRSGETRSLVLRTLVGAANTLFRKGTALFRSEAEEQQARRRKSPTESPRVSEWKNGSGKQDNQMLGGWIAREEEKKRQLQRAAAAEQESPGNNDHD